MPKKLTDEEEKIIIQLLQSGTSQVMIARIFNIDQSTVSKILKKAVEESAPEDPFAARYQRRKLR